MVGKWLLLASSLLILPSYAEAANEGEMTGQDAVAMWSLIKWAHTACPKGTLIPAQYMFAGMVEDAAPAEVLQRVEAELPAQFVAAKGSVGAACQAMRDGWTDSPRP